MRNQGVVLSREKIEQHIWNYDYAGGSNIVDVYIPDLYGKEKRKQHPSREGKLGVEGIPEAVLLEALEKAGIGVREVQERADPITKLDLFELGLSGGAQSALRRAKLMKRLELPEHLSANALVTVLASLYSREELYRLCASLFGEGEQ